MSKEWVFDADFTTRLTEARIEHLKSYLPDLIGELDLHTALDAGCGIGHFSKFLSREGLKVTGVDGRSENVQEAGRRYPDVDFKVVNVESDMFLPNCSFDLVLCCGLLYHLENPFKAVRNLSAAAGKIMIVESMVVPSKRPLMAMIDENQSEDQGLRYEAFIPSQPALVKMLYSSGFSRVYFPVSEPRHSDFRESFKHHRRRTVLVASKADLSLPMLKPIPTSSTVKGYEYWRRPWTAIVRRFV